jgi:hypothetical protein
MAVWLFVGFLAFMPLLWWISPSGSPWVPALTVGCAVCAAMNWIASRHVTQLGVLAVMAVDAVTIAIVARMYSPILIAPGLATFLVMATTITTIMPLWLASTFIPGLGLFAVMGPWFAERLDLISRTTSVTAEHTIQLHAAGVNGNESGILTVTTLYVFMLIIASTVFATAIRIRDQAVKKRIHLQAWQLRQLVEMPSA